MDMSHSDLYLELAELPLPNSVRFLGSNVIQVNSSIRDHVKNTRRAISKTLFLSGADNVTAGPTNEQRDVILTAVSTSGVRTAVLKEEQVKGEVAKKRWVEVWRQGDILELTLDVTSKHGAFYSDDYFASLSFNPSEDALVYAAEANAPQHKEDDPYNKFRFAPKLGEGLTGRRRPTLYVLRWKHNIDNRLSSPVSQSLDNEDGPTLNSLNLSPAPPRPILFGQASFIDDEKVVAVGYEVYPDGRLLGLKGCYNRLAGIWVLSFKAATVKSSSSIDVQSKPLEMHLHSNKITSKERSCRSPRVLDKSTVVWLSSSLGGAHASVSSLHVYDVSKEQDKQIVADVMTPEGTGAFPGLYPDGSNLAPRPFLRLGKSMTPYLVMSSGWGSRNTVLLINTQDGGVRNLTPLAEGVTEPLSWSVLGTDGQKRVVCYRSSVKTPHEVILGEFKDELNIKWTVLDQPTLSGRVKDALADLELSVISIPDRHPVETIVVRNRCLAAHRESDYTPPLITIPHGGPHGASFCSFSAPHIARVLQGYTLSLPNYTGSTGYGKKYVEDLLGNIGTLDVEDCMASIKHLINMGIAQEGPGKQFVSGGSHGGFLAAHLISQYPEFFSAAVMRNPVIHLGDTSQTDIPDWYFAESGIPHDPISLPRVTPEMYSKLWQASPISLVDSVTVPVLLLIGEDDERVAPAQGRSYYYALKQREQKVEMLCFPGESHPLDGIEAARVSWEAESILFWEVAGL